MANPERSSSLQRLNPSLAQLIRLFIWPETLSAIVETTSSAKASNICPPVENSWSELNLRWFHFSNFSPVILVLFSPAYAVSRYCQPNGTWVLTTIKNYSWEKTDYTPCVSTIQTEVRSHYFLCFLGGWSHCIEVCVSMKQSSCKFALSRLRTGHVNAKRLGWQKRELRLNNATWLQNIEFVHL